MQHQRGRRVRAVLRGEARTVTVNVIILAQGQQSRLPELAIPKQLIPLPDCKNTPILERTFCQLSIMRPSAHITLVADDRVIEKAMKFSASSKVTFCTLKDPGNSSLKGLYRYFLQDAAYDPETHRTVVLLGDVIYSWDCLFKLFSVGNGHVGAPIGVPVNFVGTSNLSPGGGELWGVSWWEQAHKPMLQSLARAMAKHPPASVNDTYQPGQLRRLLWDIDENHAWMFGVMDDPQPWFTACDDYTMDVDVPEHVTDVREGLVSNLAKNDDKKHGLVW